MNSFKLQVLNSFKLPLPNSEENQSLDKQIKWSGQVRPRQGTEICNFGAPSPLEALHWIFCFFSSIYVQFRKTSPLKSGESSENPVEKIASNPVTSVAVMVFFGPEMGS